IYVFRTVLKYPESHSILPVLDLSRQFTGHFWLKLSLEYLATIIGSEIHDFNLSQAVMQSLLIIHARKYQINYLRSSCLLKEW
ncbi:BgTH12-06382, partial [Blumeria graminis f. sp. triticale]